MKRIKRILLKCIYTNSKHLKGYLKVCLSLIKIHVAGFIYIYKNTNTKVKFKLIFYATVFGWKISEQTNALPQKKATKKVRKSVSI